MKLNDISDADKAKPERTEPQAADYSTVSVRLGFLSVDTVMHDSTFRGQSVFIPGPLDVDQSALPPAEDEMLKGGNRG